MTDARTYHGSATPDNPLSDADVDAIINATFQLMREIGVKFDPQARAMGLFSDAGCDISSDGIVKFPEELVRKSIDSVGKSVKLWNRSGSEHIEFSDGHTILMAGVTCPNVIDTGTGEQRPATAEDIATITRVADALADVDGVCLPCKMSERPDVYGQIQECAILVENTSKPLTYLCEDKAPLEAAVEMAAAIRGGAGQLREKPYFCFMVTPLSLYYAEQHIDHIFLCVENGIPLFPCTTNIGGASAPITIAGNIVHCLATDLACIVLTQLIEEGGFCTCGSIPVFMDPATGEIGGFPEMALAEAARTQVLRSLALPPCGGTAGSCAGRKEFDRYNACVATATMLETAYSRPGYCWCLGSIDTLMTFSLHALLYCNELAGWLRRVWEGVRVDGDTLALDVTRSVGPGGDYLAEMHTARHCRTELWNPKYFRFAWEEGNENKKGLMAVIDEDLRRILNEHHPESLPDSVKKQIEAILKKYGVS